MMHLTGRATTAFAMLVLATMVAAPAALAAPPMSPPDQSNGVAHCVDVVPGGPQTGGNVGNDRPNGGVDCDDDQGHGSGGAGEPADDTTDGDSTDGDTTDDDSTDDDSTDDTADARVGEHALTEADDDTTDVGNETHTIDDPTPIEADETPAPSAGDGTPDTGGADASAACGSDLLVAYTPGGVEGDDRAVVLTAQALDADTAGWLHVSWQTADGVSVTSVAVVHADGLVVLEGDDLGTVDDVLAIAFCGVRDDTGPSPSTGDTEVRGAVLVAPTTPTAAEVEVLGVTLARTGANSSWLVVVGLVATLAGAGALWTTRRHHEEVTG